MNSRFNILIFVILIIGGCKSSKLNTHNTESKKLENILSLLNEKQIQYDWFSAKANIEINTPNLNQSATLYLRMSSDSLIWGSVNVLLGLEVVRFFIDKEQITFIDKFHKEYRQYSFDELSKMYGIDEIDYSFIENLILGNLVFDLRKDFDVESFDDDLIMVSEKGPIKKQVFIHSKDAYVYQYKAERIGNNQKIELNYEDKISSEKYVIPKFVDIKVFLPEKNTFTLNFNNIQFGKAFTVNTSIPKGYVKVE